MADKRTVRDISESLGKLPPSAPELEDTIIGGLMVCRNEETTKILKILKAEHFHQESHSIIFSAIQSLHEKGDPIDLKSVIHTLREIGKLELVGGAHTVATLHGSFSFSGDLAYPVRIIIEMYLKRAAITIASQIHHDAYQDDADALHLIPDAIQRLQYLFDRSVKQSDKEKLKDEWMELLVSTEPPEVPPLIIIQNTPVATPGNISLIVGKKKSRKSLFITWELSEMFKTQYVDPNSVCIFDTEQGRRHVWKYGDRIRRMSGKQVPIFTLMGKTPEERREFIDLTVQYWPVNIRLIVIDGIRDMMHDINDSRESSLVVTWIQKLMLKGIHIINVLHQNKTDKNPRGHIGSELTNKSEVTIEVELDNPNDPNSVSIVKCESAREKPFEAWAFTHSTDDLPILTDTPIMGKQIPTDERKRRLSTIFEDGPIGYARLQELIADNFAVGKNKAGQLIAEFKRLHWIVKNGPDKAPGTVYKLMVSENGHDSQQLEIMPMPDNPPMPTSEDLPF